tara:strand:+ start:3962 stop:4135 length:174 start_codon:yes stop_codon:yes gene_type:complete
MNTIRHVSQRTGHREGGAAWVAPHKDCISIPVSHFALSDQHGGALSRRPASIKRGRA